MDINKHMSFKAGYQNKEDAMRKNAEKLMDHPGHAKDVYPSKSTPSKEKMRAYKAGGSVKCGCNDHKNKEAHKYAAGGAAKIRHEVATADGKPRKMPKKSYKDSM